MTNPDSKGNGELGVAHEQVLILTVTFNTRTAQVNYKCTEMPFALAQMIMGEVQRQLEEQRRAAVAMALQTQLRQQAADQAIVENLRRTAGKG